MKHLTTTLLLTLLVSGGLWAEVLESWTPLDKEIEIAKEIIKEETKADIPKGSLPTHGLKCTTTNDSAPKKVYVYPNNTSYPWDISIFKDTDDSGWYGKRSMCLSPSNENFYFIRFIGGTNKNCKSSFNSRKEVTLDRTSLELIFNEAETSPEYRYSDGTGDTYYYQYDWKYDCSFLLRQKIIEETDKIIKKEKEDRKL